MAPLNSQYSDHDADVLVVGAGPARSTAATYLARAGINVLLLEKTAFPREKVCGDALPPRGVKQLIDLGINTSAEAGWMHSRGIRIVTGDLTREFDWPDLAELSRTRNAPSLSSVPVGHCPVLRLRGRW